MRCQSKVLERPALYFDPSLSAIKGNTMRGDEYIAKILKEEGVEWLPCFPSNPLIYGGGNIRRALKAGVNLY